MRRDARLDATLLESERPLFRRRRRPSLRRLLVLLGATALTVAGYLLIQGVPV